MRIIFEFDNEEQVNEFINSISDRIASEVIDAIHKHSSYKKEIKYTDLPYRYKEVTFNTYEDAKDILNALYEILIKFDSVRVSDLYDLAGVCVNYRDRVYGWDDLGGARVISKGKQWTIDLPQPKLLKEK